jgi:hypothetical protein
MTLIDYVTIINCIGLLYIVIAITYKSNKEIKWKALIESDLLTIKSTLKIRNHYTEAELETTKENQKT